MPARVREQQEAILRWRSQKVAYRLYSISPGTLTRLWVEIKSKTEKPCSLWTSQTRQTLKP